jgi:hypothetical protein
MIGFRRYISILFKLLFLCAVLAIAPINDANAKKKADSCSAEGQKPCPAHYKGPICDPGLGKIQDVCRKCGGEKQLPALRWSE